MTNKKPKRVVSDIRPPVRKTPTVPKTMPAEASKPSPVDEQTNQNLSDAFGQPIDKKVTVLAVITILAVGGWLVYINYFS